MKLRYLYMLLFTSLILQASMAFEEEDGFYEDKYEKIIRFKPLCFEHNTTLKSSSLKRFDEIIKKISDLNKTSKLFEITLVGHSYNEDAYYPKKIQNSLDYTMATLDKKSKSSEYVGHIKEKLLKADVDKNILHEYAQGGRYLLATDETKESSELSNCVMVSIYVLNDEDRDSDHDGVLNKYDRCKNTPQGAKVDKNGCPLDSDHDGVYNYLDECPKTPLNVIVDAYGCPLDSDNDGVVDYLDRCPNTPEGLSVNKDGCPLTQTLKLHFNRKSDKILMQYIPEVEKFAKFLQKNPLYKVKIIGHTDNIGTIQDNLDLSIRRAKSVKEALVKEGIDASRISVDGEGELHPIATNKTKEGRAKNRRIEIKLLK